MKNIYLVRHGETAENKAHRHQSYDTPLSEYGQQQAKVVAKYIKTIQPDTVFTSPFPRARETAKFISLETDVPYTIIESVHEILRPTFLYGKSHYSFATARYLGQLFMNRGDNGWNNDDAENMFDLRNRVLDTKKLVINNDGQSIVVVSHAIFIDFFIHLVCQEKLLSFLKFLRLLIFVKKIPNTAVVHIQYDEEAVLGICPWQLVSITTPENFNSMLDS